MAGRGRGLGDGRSSSAITYGTLDLALQRRWTRRNAAWDLSWRAAQELIRRSLDAARGRKDALIACGVGTDHLFPRTKA